MKFSGSDLDVAVPYDYGNRWCREDYDSWSRITVGPSDNHIEVLLRLSEVIPPPYWILWVLIIPASDHKPGRYESSMPVDIHELSRLLRKYRLFFEGDGRHHLWILGTEQRERIIYDNHNLLYAYGPLDDFARVLTKLDFSKSLVSIPTPHSHQYDPKNAGVEDMLFSEREWKWSPLIEEHDDP